MSNPALIKQVYWPGDTDEQLDAKRARLHQAMFPGQQKHPFAIEVTVKRHQKKRSPEANSYLWGVCYPLLSDASGYEKEEIHHLMCCKFFGTKVVEIMGERITRPVRTTTTNEEGEPEWLDPATFGEFIEMVIREASLWYDVTIPPPTPKDIPHADQAH